MHELVTIDTDFIDARFNYETNVEKYCRPGQARDGNTRIIWKMRTVCCITKTTDTHSECVIIIAFTQQQCLHESASVLRCKYIACLG